MPKKGLNSKNVAGLLKEGQSQMGWALCIGAGTSVPLFPSWNELVEALITEINGKEKAKTISKELLKIFSPDSLIQAAHNTLSLPDDKFIKILSDKLFAPIKLKINSSEWEIFKKAQLADGPAAIPYDDWENYDKICATHFSECSAYNIAKVLVEARDKNIGPTNILSFNAETILFSFLNLFLWKKYAQANGKNPAKKGQLAKHFDFITHSISTRSSNRIPYILCHGILPVSNDPNKEKKRIGGVSKLVFAETAYLQLANNSFSWQSSSFLDVCGKRKVLFIGVSLSDPNMRRWLSWLHDNRIKELSTITTKQPNDSTNHFWINKRPTNPSETKWIEATVSHLGVRLIWINDWRDLEKTLRSMLSLSNKLV